MAERSIAGHSNGKIAAWLNSEKIPTSRGCTWKPETVGTVLRGHALAGYAMRKGSRVRDDDGGDVLITADPILDDETWRKVQAALDSRKQKRAERKGGHMLLRVAYCRKCSDYVPAKWRMVNGEPVVTEATGKNVPMYGHLGQGRNRTRDIYRCQQCGYSVSKSKLESTLEKLIMHAVGNKPLPRKVVIPAISHTAELATLDAKIADIERLIESDEMPARSGARMLTRLEAERDRLTALPQRAERIVYEPTDQTVAEHWATLDTEGRGRFLRKWGATIHADRDGFTARGGWEYFDPAAGNAMAEAFGIAPDVLSAS